LVLSSAAARGQQWRGLTLDAGDRLARSGPPMAPRYGLPAQHEKHEESTTLDSPELHRRHRLAQESSIASESEVSEP
jgi:hypothetical protein